jgi:hypothetical protein
MPKTAIQDPDRQRLLDKGWKLLSVDGKKRYWISPYDDKTYVEPHALTVQDMKDVEKRQAELTRPSSWEPNDVNLTEEEFDRRFPPVKKKATKKAKPKKSAKKPVTKKRSKNAKQR